MSRGPDAGAALERALVKDARAAGCAVEIAHADWQRWASATFTGARHQVMVEGTTGDEVDAWLAALPETDLPLGGYLLADLAIVSVSRIDRFVQIAIEALTVER